MPQRSCQGIALVAAAAVLLVAVRAADPPDLDTAYAEKVLQDAKIGLDAADLLKYFRDRTLSDEEKLKLASKIKLLGDETFSVREQASADLVRAGRVVVPFLKAALNDTDLEVARRAERCLEEIASNPDLVLAPAAARLLMARKPDGATETLMNYLPFVDDDNVELALLEALARGVKGGKADAVLVKALKDKDAIKRGAAAFVLGRAEPEQAKLVAALLTDPDARVRFRAAAARARAADRDAVPVLTALVGDGPFPLAVQAEEMLYRIGGEQAPATSLRTDADSRRKARGVWEEWWKTNEKKVDLAKIDFEDALQGLNIVVLCDYKGKPGRVFEFRSDGKPRWEVDQGINCPADAQALPGGRVLIAEYQANQVSERERDGKVLWTRKVDRYATTCQRLPNGNTFIATYGEVMEISPKGDTVYSHKTRGGWGEIYRAQKLRNGNIVLVCGGNKVIELDATGKEVRVVPVQGTNPFACVEALPGGRYLVALYGAGKVVEVDGDGKVHWEVKVPSPSSAQRLPNGHTLVSSMDAKRVVEFDRDGKEVWHQDVEGRPFRVRRY
jgi:HEAT repeat protein/outer membrane protein assembly factor BamB